ncbi:N-acetyltransferase ats1 [Hyphodiscus hymeniophilus]|uniref:N-acetyltransferase ats1 n=1 Tax=Hyphodiscus hymeniophilus TaxID=353542 RepID=A0A9P7B0U9_9HELO|nr:N-acetyltransferase ats1 [Hyphodiscus hymeniophilus]
MEMNLVVPVPEGEARQEGIDEELNGVWWRVKGPIETADMEHMKFHCVSYVWGAGMDRAGSFFDCKRDISDRTKPALEAAMKAAQVMSKNYGTENVEAFWIDAICVPQAEGASRHGTLESMGFIYSKAVSVIVVLQGPAWEIVKKAASSNTAMQLSLGEMEDLELDTWISRVWTYQEMVNNNRVYFTTFDPVGQQVIVPYEPLLNCVGYSSARWTKDTETSTAEFQLKFPNLNNLADTLLDATVSGYLERSALGVLSNMSARRYDPQYPGNRLLASLGALTQKPSWSPAAALSELAEKLMSTCEEVNDYSFIYTCDERDERPGLGWRPNPDQPERSDERSAHLIPVLSWTSYGEPFGSTQRAHRDSQGLWLDNMIPLRTSGHLNVKVKQRLEMWLYGGEKDPEHPEQVPGVGFLGRGERGKSDLIPAIFRSIQIVGFTGSAICQVYVPQILALIQELADYEHESAAVEATHASLLSTIVFAPSGLISPSNTTPSTGDPISASRPARCLLVFPPSPPPNPAEIVEPKAVGLALYFYNYSTWRAKPGIYLEDLYVRESERGKGYGQRLLGELAKEVLELDGGRLEWSVLKWNTPSIEFYERIGAKAMGEWQTMRVDGEGLKTLAKRAG